MARYIDPIDSPTTATVQLCRLLRRLAVQPDAAFCLLIPAEQSLQRSRVRSRYNWETLDVLQQRCDEYRALGTELGVEILDGNQPAASLAETPQSKLEGCGHDTCRRDLNSGVKDWRISHRYTHAGSRADHLS